MFKNIKPTMEDLQGNANQSPPPQTPPAQPPQKSHPFRKFLLKAAAVGAGAAAEQVALKKLDARDAQKAAAAATSTPKPQEENTQSGSTEDYLAESHDLALMEREIATLELFQVAINSGASPDALLALADADGSLTDLLGADPLTMSLEELQEELEEKTQDAKRAALKKKRIVLAAKIGVALAALSAVAVTLSKARGGGKRPTSPVTPHVEPKGGTPTPSWDPKVKPIMGKMFTLLDKARLVESVVHSADLEKPLPSLDVAENDGNATSAGPIQYAEYVTDALKSAARAIGAAERKAKTDTEVSNLKTLSDHVKTMTDELAHVVDTKIYTVKQA